MTTYCPTCGIHEVTDGKPCAECVRRAKERKAEEARIEAAYRKQTSKPRNVADAWNVGRRK